MIGTETNKGPSSSALKQLESALHAGIPSELRKTVWSLTMPNDLKINQKMYDIFLERAKICQENQDKDHTFRKNLLVIEKDLHRTHSEMNIFRYGNRCYQPLKNVLMAYSLYRPDLGYVQGMSYVAASILLHYNDELETFKCLANLLNREDMLYNFYSFDMEKVNVVFHIFMRLLSEKLPELSEVFVSTGISCSIFLFEWIIAMYSNIFQLDLSSRIWDSILYFGEFYIMKTALAICVCISETQDMSSFENVVLIVKNVK